MKKTGVFCRFLALALSACLFAGGLAGCSGASSPEELFALPQPPENYQNLSQKITEVLSATGGESIAPKTGSNTQTVQLQDLDGDGVQESAVAFFQVSGDEKPLKIYIFRLQEDDSYALSTVIEGLGTGINSVAYENVGGGPEKELIVAWQISTTDHTLGVYSLSGAEGIELLWVERYNRFRIADLDEDGEREIVALTLKAGEEEIDRADFYDYDGVSLTRKESVPLSMGITEIRMVRGGALRGGTPAVFVTSSFGESPQGQVVDVLACREGTFTNVTLDPETVFSTGTVRSYTAVSGADINGDGILELPRPKALPVYNRTAVSEEFWILDWLQFDLEGETSRALTTYHNVTDGWYFSLPDGWGQRLTLSRKDSNTADERAVTFSLWKGEDQEPVRFMTIYKLTGANRARRATMGNRQSLYTDTNAVYAYELWPDEWDTGLTHEEIVERFNIIRPEWSTDY